MKSRDQNYMERNHFFAKNHCTGVRGQRTRRCFVLRCFRWTGKQWFMENTFCVIFLCATVFSRPRPPPHRPFFFIRPSSQNNTTTTAAFLSPDSWARTSTCADCCTPPPGITTAVGQWRRRIRFRVHDDERRPGTDKDERLARGCGASGSEWARESMSIGQTPRNIKNERRTIKVRIRS